MYVTFTHAGVCPYKGLYEAYLHNRRDLLECFTYNPWGAGAFAARARDLDRLDRRHWREAGKALEEYNRGLSAPGPALEAAALLARGEALAVVTGQQAGFVGGPLLTLYKALTAIKLARRLQSELGRPVVAVFWVASEDHDYAEISWLRFIDAFGRFRRLDLGSPASLRVPAGFLPVPPAAESLMRELEAALGPLSHGRELLDLVRDCLSSAESLAHSFALLYSRLLGGEGLVMADPLFPGLRALALPVWRRTLELGTLPLRLLEQAGERLAAMGFKPGLDLEPGHALLFWHDGGERVALFWREGRLSDRGGSRSWTPEELLDLAQASPGCISSNVVTRALLQDWLIPTLAEVVGPGGLAYMAQLKEVYAAFGRTQPVLFPRLSLTLLTRREAAVMAQHGVGVAQVAAGLPAAVSDLVGADEGVGLRKRFALERRFVTERYRQLKEELQGIDPALGPLADANLARVLHQIEYLEEKALQSHRRRYRSQAEELRRLAETAWPLGRPQEQMLSALPWLARGGTGLISAILELAPLTGENQIAYLDA
ncbi:MAG: bacillithiol biosynthesis cysteine-adding enzyme BshC [Acetobacteraceae bacterium]|nr:bacillithiol biosynthesis cysteine-adding enzyme BshC [Acetobacteraceae bacterium]